MPSTPTRALIADDEPLARRGIRQLLARHPDVVVVGECRNGIEVLKTAEADLLFLDVQMPGMGGFQVLRNWGKRPLPLVVFVTAYEEFAVRAFEAAALDYLVKPVTQARFDACMVRVRERLRMGGAAAMADRLARLLAESPPLLVQSAEGAVLLDPLDVDWIEADDYSATVHAGEKTYRLRESLRSLERRLDPRLFVRVHRGAIVRLARVRDLRTTAAGTELVLRSGARIPVSRRRREQLVRSLRKGLPTAH